MKTIGEDGLQGGSRQSPRAIAERKFRGTERFRIEERLGSGAMGTVYRAFDRETRAEVAIKVLDNPKADALERFKREFRSIQDIQHPNLIGLGELAESDGVWFFSMELISGVDFLSYVGADQRRVRSALRQLASGLATLHRAGKVHRDVKPSNILVTDNARVVLLDFGLVLDSASSDRISDDCVVGTGAYLAPEQVRPAAAGPASDCYAMGVVLYQALTEKLPFVGPVVATLMRKQDELPPSPRELQPDVPEDLDQLCMELLQIDPADRPTAEEVARRLGGALAGPLEMPRRATFVGRRRELDFLMAQAGARRPRVVVVRGESGMGKTALMGHFERRMRIELPDALILSGRCYERESVPFKGIDGVVESLSRVMRRLDLDEVLEVVPDAASLLTQAFPSLKRVPSFRELSQVRSEAVDPLESRRKVFAALRQLLSRLAARGPVVVVVDDMQWAGGDSWDLLEHLMHPPDAPPLLLVLMTRPKDDQVDAAVTLHHVFGEVSELSLEALTPDEARDLARTLLAELGCADLSPADQVAAEAEGHPLFIAQLVRHMVESGTSDTPVARLDDALLARFARLSDNARNVLQLVATAGLPHPQALIASACNLDYATFTRHVTELRIAHFIRSSGARGNDTIEHYHDRIREVALAQLSEDERAKLHMRLAETLEDTGLAEREPELAVHHLIAGGAPQRAGYYACGAADRAMSAMAFERAAALYRLAIDHGDYPAAERRRLRLRLAEALIADGRGVDAAEIYLQEADAGDAADRLDCKRRAAEQLLVTGHLARGVEVMGAVLDEIGEKLPSSPRRALMSAVWQRFCLRLRGLRWTSRDESEIAPRDLVRLEVYKSVSTGLSMVDNITGAAYQGRHLRLALKLGETERVVRALSIEGVFLASLVAEHRAREVARLVTEWSDRSRDPVTRAYSLFAVAAVDFFMDNRWRHCLDTITTSESLMRDHYRPAGWEHDTVRMYRCFCLMFLGELRQLGDLMRRYVRECERRGDLYGAVNLRSRLVIPWLVADDVEGGAESLERALAAWRPWKDGYLVQHFFALHSACELGLYRGDPEGAQRILDEQHEALADSLLLRVPMVKSEIEFARGRIALMRAQASEGSERRQHLESAQRIARWLSKAPVPAPRMWAKLLDAGVLTLIGNGTIGIKVLRTAVEELERSENRLYAACARHHLGELLGGSDGLDAREGTTAWANEQGVVNLLRFATAMLGWAP